MSATPSTKTTATLRDEDIETLRMTLRGPLLRPGEPGYDEARTVWNAMIDRRPGLIARCAGAADVIAAVRFAREHELLLSVMGGGHNVAGKAVCEGGLMIDLSGIKEIEVDPTRRTARAGAGVLWQELDQATQVHGLATTGGAISSTGIAGLTLGGGIGFLARRFGLSCDNLISADIVTADGQLRVASEQENADLFWAIRGGGGNFGVVTSFTYQLHAVGPTVLGGVVLYPLELARDVLRVYRDTCRSAPDELAIVAGVLTAPDGTRAAAVIPCYSGPLDEGQRVLEPLRRIGPPLVDTIDPLPYTSMQQLFDPSYPAGRRSYWKSSFVDDLNDDAIETLLNSFDRVPSPWSAIEFETMGGAVRRIADQATAFGHRGSLFNMTIVSLWADAEDDAANVRWTRETWEAMRPFESPAVYVNYLSDGEEDRIRAAYGVNYERLAALKRRYDPTNLFRMNQNIQPVA